jgi:NAD(P)-dependent dehydrogenase (short-subunit alcohol dehydrogenase family)
LKRVLITGGNGGIGFEFVRQYLEAGWRVYATCRRPADSESLHELKKLHTRLSLHQLDITIPEDLNSITHHFAGTPIDLLINNSSVFFDTDKTGLEHIDYERWLRTLEVNTLGTMRVIEAMLDSIEAGENGINLVVVLSCLSGSRSSHDMSAGLYYRSSKAALNSAMQDIAVDLEHRNIGLLMLYPGQVIGRLDDTSGISAKQSVIGMRQVIREYSPGKNGCFYAYDGSEIIGRDISTAAQH